MKCTYLKHIRIISLATMLLLGAPAFAAEQPQTSTPWETVSSTASGDGTDSQAYEAFVRNGFVYVTVPKPVTVKVYTILGQLVSQQTVAAGTSRLRLQVRGIYILKMGEVTRRINV